MCELYADYAHVRQPASRQDTANGAYGQAKGTCLRRQYSAQARQKIRS